MFEEVEKTELASTAPFSEHSGRILQEMIAELSDHSQTSRFNWMTRFALRLSSVVQSSHLFVADILSPPDSILETVVFTSYGVVRDNIQYTADKSPIQRIIVHRDPLVIESELARYFPDDPMISSWQAESCVCLPLQTEKGEVIGVLAWFHQEPQSYQATTMAVFRVLARLVAMELRQHSRQKIAQIQKAQNKTWAKIERKLFANNDYEESLRMRLDAYQDIAQGFAHEIRNPLNLIVNAAKLMEQEVQRLQKNFELTDMAATSQLMKNLEMIQHGGQRLNHLINVLWERLSLRQKASRYCDLNRVLLEQINLIRRQFPHQLSHTTIKYDFADDMPLVYLSPEALGKVISNILLNSVQAIEEKKRLLSREQKSEQKELTIDIISRFENHEIRIEIIDDGIGFDQQQIVQIFDPFFSTKPPGKGLGLGLSLSYQIITEDYGGQIRATRTEDDRTLFGIYLPYENLSGCQH